VTSLAQRTRWALAAAWAVVILVGSLVEGGGGTLPPSGPLGLAGADKWIHAAEYGLLAGLVAWASVPRTGADHLRILVAVVGYGVAIELLQAPLATRSGDPADAAANAVGAAVVLAVWVALGLSGRTAFGSDVDDGDEDGPSRSSDGP
jgi:VanZ family protein